MTLCSIRPRLSPPRRQPGHSTIVCVTGLRGTMRGWPPGRPGLSSRRRPGSPRRARQLRPCSTRGCRRCRTRGCRPGRCRSPTARRWGCPRPRTCPAWRSSRSCRAVDRGQAGLGEPASARRRPRSVLSTSTPRWLSDPPWPGFSMQHELQRRLGEGEVGVAGAALGGLGAEEPGVERDGLVHVVDVESELESGHRVLLDIDGCRCVSPRLPRTLTPVNIDACRSLSSSSPRSRRWPAAPR